MGGPERTGDDLGAAVSEEIGRLYLEAFGKGPGEIATDVHQDTVVAVLRDVLTASEKTLLEAGHGELVRRTRLLAQDAADKALCSSVADLSGRRVLACIGGINLDHQMASEVFVLAPA